MGYFAMTDEAYRVFVKGETNMIPYLHSEIVLATITVELVLWMLLREQKKLRFTLRRRLH